MNESDALTVIRIWAALAWADGRIASSEAAALRKLIDDAPLSPEDRQTALGWLEEHVDLDPYAPAIQGEEECIIVYRAAVKLALVDWEVAQEELQFLRRLRRLLNLDENVARSIESDVLSQMQNINRS